MFIIRIVKTVQVGNAIYFCWVRSQDVVPELNKSSVSGRSIDQVCASILILAHNGPLLFDEWNTIINNKRVWESSRVDAKQISCLV